MAIILGLPTNSNTTIGKTEEQREANAAPRTLTDRYPQLASILRSTDPRRLQKYMTSLMQYLPLCIGATLDTGLVVKVRVINTRTRTLKVSFTPLPEDAAESAGTEQRGTYQTITWHPIQLTVIDGYIPEPGKDSFPLWIPGRGDLSRLPYRQLLAVIQMYAVGAYRKLAAFCRSHGLPENVYRPLLDTIQDLKDTYCEWKGCSHENCPKLSVIVAEAIRQYDKYVRRRAHGMKRKVITVNPAFALPYARLSIGMLLTVVRRAAELFDDEHMMSEIELVASEFDLSTYAVKNAVKGCLDTYALLRPETDVSGLTLEMVEDIEANILDFLVCSMTMRGRSPFSCPATKPRSRVAQDTSAEKKSEKNSEASDSGSPTDTAIPAFRPLKLMIFVDFLEEVPAIGYRSRAAKEAPPKPESSVA